MFKILNFSFLPSPASAPFPPFGKGALAEIDRYPRSLSPEMISSQIVWILNTMNHQLFKTKTRVFSLNQKRWVDNFQNLRQTSSLKNVKKSTRVNKNKTQKQLILYVYKDGSFEKKLKTELQFKCKPKKSSFKNRFFLYKTTKVP
jgi:hypothetical protein